MKISGWITPNGEVIFCSSEDYFTSIKESPEFKQHLDIADEVKMYTDLEITFKNKSGRVYRDFMAHKRLSYNRICRNLYYLLFIRFHQQDEALTFYGVSTRLTRKTQHCTKLATENKLKAYFLEEL